MMERWKMLVLIVGGAVTIGGGIYTAATILGKLDYATQAVNPDAVIEYRVKEAVLSTKREIRWCLGKAALAGQTAQDALGCAD